MKILSLISPSKPEFEKAVHKVLQRPEYNTFKYKIKDFIGYVKDTIYNWLFKILKKASFNMDTAASMSEKLSIVFIVIGILVILTIIVLIIIKLSKTFERKRKIRISEILGEKIDSKTTPNSLRDKAESFANQGDYRQAIRFDFIALLLLMHQNNFIYLDETKTNEEIYRYLQKNNFKQLAIFKNMIDDFNSHWYGHKLCNAYTYKIWKDNVNLVWNEVIYHET